MIEDILKFVKVKVLPLDGHVTNIGLWLLSLSTIGINPVDIALYLKAHPSPIAIGMVAVGVIGKYLKRNDPTLPDFR